MFGRVKKESGEKEEGVPAKLAYILNYDFPQTAKDVLRKRHPTWSGRAQAMAWAALREFFLANAEAKKVFQRQKQSLGMPSVLADEAWHVFMSLPKMYHEFCLKAFGELLDHTPDINATPKRMEMMRDVGSPARKTFFAIDNLYKTSKHLVSKAHQKEDVGFGVSPGQGKFAMSMAPLLFIADAMYMKELGVGWFYGTHLLKELGVMTMSEALMKKSEDGSGCGTLPVDTGELGTDGGGGSGCGSGCGD